MGSPSNMGRGLRGSRSARSQPQRAWDSFLLASCVLETPTRGTGICPEAVSASTEELGMVADTSERAMLETVPSSGPKPRRRGRPRKKSREGEEDCPKAELSARPTLEESVILTNHSELVGTTEKEAGEERGGQKHWVLPSKIPLSN
jgi:hypothetical protein